MEIITTYRSDDGTEFDTEEECLAYEAVYRNTDSVLVFDEDLDLFDMDDLEEVFNEASYIHIVDAQAARLLFDFVESSYGSFLPSEIEEGHTYHYVDGGWSGDLWEDLDEEYQRVKNRYDSVQEALQEIG